MDVAEQKRLNDAREAQITWKKWGPYLSERQWGTVCEDYSSDGKFRIHADGYNFLPYFKGEGKKGTRSVPGWPLLINLRTDPYEKGPNEADLGYLRWYGDNLWTFGPGRASSRSFCPSSRTTRSRRARA